MADIIKDNGQHFILFYNRNGVLIYIQDKYLISILVCSNKEI